MSFTSNNSDDINKQFRPSQEDWKNLFAFVKMHPELLGPQSKSNKLWTSFAASRCPKGDEPRTREAWWRSFNQRIITARSNAKRGTQKPLDSLTLETLENVQSLNDVNVSASNTPNRHQQQQRVPVKVDRSNQHMPGNFDQIDQQMIQMGINRRHQLQQMVQPDQQHHQYATSQYLQYIEQQKYSQPSFPYHHPHHPSSFHTNKNSHLRQSNPPVLPHETLRPPSSRLSKPMMLPAQQNKQRMGSTSPSDLNEELVNTYEAMDLAAARPLNQQKHVELQSLNGLESEDDNYEIVFEMGPLKQKPVPPSVCVQDDPYMAYLAKRMDEMALAQQQHHERMESIVEVGISEYSRDTICFAMTNF